MFKEGLAHAHAIDNKDAGAMEKALEFIAAIGGNSLAPADWDENDEELRVCTAAFLLGDHYYNAIIDRVHVLFIALTGRVGAFGGTTITKLIDDLRRPSMDRQPHLSRALGVIGKVLEVGWGKAVNAEGEPRDPGNIEEAKADLVEAVWTEVRLAMEAMQYDIDGREKGPAGLLRTLLEGAGMTVAQIISGDLPPGAHPIARQIDKAIVAKGVIVGVLEKLSMDTEAFLECHDILQVETTGKPQTLVSAVVDEELTPDEIEQLLTEGQAFFLKGETDGELEKPSDSDVESGDPVPGVASGSGESPDSGCTG